MEINTGNFYINIKLQPMNQIEHNEGTLKDIYKYKATIITSKDKTEILFDENGKSFLMNKKYDLIQRINYNGSIGLYTNFELKRDRTLIVNQLNNEIHIQSITRYSYQEILAKKTNLENIIRRGAR